MDSHWRRCRISNTSIGYWPHPKMNLWKYFPTWGRTGRSGIGCPGCWASWGKMPGTPKMFTRLSSSQHSCLDWRPGWKPSGLGGTLEDSTIGWTVFLEGMQPQFNAEGRWEYPHLEKAMAAAGLKEVETYVLCRQKKIAQYILTLGSTEMVGAWGFRLGGIQVGGGGRGLEAKGGNGEQEGIMMWTGKHSTLVT